MKGTVKFFNESKGYGFIEQEDSESDIFFHISEVLSQDVLQKEDKVSFELGEGREGKEAAIKVQLVEEGA